MSKAEKAALARMLEDIARKLEEAPQRAQDAATECGEESPHARRCYELGALQAQVREAMHSLRVASKNYLEPVTTKKAG